MVQASRISDLVSTAQRMEALGYESIWIPEFHNQDGFVRITAVAAATERITIASGIVNAFNRAPAMIAAAAADIDELSNGRFILGLGTGTRRMQEAWYGIEYKPPAPRTEELTSILRSMWKANKGPAFKHSGRFYDIDIAPYGRPNLLREDIPIHLAAVNKRMIRTAGEYGDGLVGHPLYSMDWIKNAVIPSMEDGLSRADKAREEFSFSSFIITGVSEDREEARMWARLQIGFYATVHSYLPIWEVGGWGGLADGIRESFRSRDIAGIMKAIPDDMVDAIAIAGTPDECREALARYEGLIDVPVFYPPSFGLPGKDAKRARDHIIEAFAPARS